MRRGSTPSACSAAPEATCISPGRSGGGPSRPRPAASEAERLSSLAWARSGRTRRRNLARDAASEGADALLLAPVSYTPLTEEEVYQHFAAVAEATDLPLCVYNNPGTTHFTFSDALLERLAAVPNIKAVKMPLPKDMDFKGEAGTSAAGHP